MESHYDAIAIIAGIVQTVLYCDFFYLYITKGKNERLLTESVSIFIDQRV